MALRLLEVLGLILMVGCVILCRGQEEGADRFGGSHHPHQSSHMNRPHQRPQQRPQPGPPYDYQLDLVYERDQNSQSNLMQVLYSWKQLDFVFPNEGMRQRMIQDRQFVPLNTLILDVEAYGEGPNRKVFVSLPRSRPGVPVTLAKVSQRRDRNGAHLLEPYPDWRSHLALLEGRCQEGLTSVFRTHVDECGRLWVLDSGNSNVFAGNSTLVCQPKVLIYDLRTDRLIGKYPLPMSIVENSTLLVTIVVDIRQGDCGNAYAYIADALAYKLIVFDLHNQQYWRINNILFFAYPDQARFAINGVSFDLNGGLFGLSLGPIHRGNKRILYFHSLAGVRQGWADTDVIRNQSLWSTNMNGNVRAFNLFKGTRPSQSAAAFMNDKGYMFFGLISTNEIACWNTQDKFDKKNIERLVRDDNTLQFASGIKIYKNKLYVATNRLQNFLTNQINPSEENYRVVEGDIDRLTRGTRCEVTSHSFNRFGDEYVPDRESVEYSPDTGLPV